jgi:hypothetical protein
MPSNMKTVAVHRRGYLLHSTLGNQVGFSLLLLTFITQQNVSLVRSHRCGLECQYMDNQHVRHDSQDCITNSTDLMRTQMLSMLPMHTVR